MKQKYFKIVLSILFFILSIHSVALAQNETESSDFSYPLKLYNQEFYDLAAQQFIKYYTNYPGSARADQAHYYAAMSFFNLKEFDKARVEFQTLAISFPKSDKAAEAWLKTGMSSEKLGDMEAAAKAYETIRLLYPSDPLAPMGVFKAGSIYLNQQQYNLAFQTFQIIVNRYSASSLYPKALLKSAICLLFQQETEKALQVVNKVLQMQTDQNTLAEGYFFAARILSKLGYFPQAQNKLTYLLANYPESQYFKEAVFLQAKLYLSDNNPQMARKLLQKYFSEKGFSKTHILLGDIYYFQNKFSEAISEYKSYSDTTDFLITQLKIAVCQRHLNQKEHALTTLKDVIANEKESGSALLKTVDSLYILWLKDDGRYDEAISILSTKRAMRHSGLNQHRLTIRLAELLAKNNRWLDVIHELQPMTLNQSFFAQKDYMLFLLAQAFENTNQYQESIFYYTKLINEMSASRYFDQAMIHLDRLQSFKMINTDQAVSKFAQIVASLVNQEDRTNLQVQTGKIFLNELKDFELAEKQFKAALADTSGATGDIHLLLGKTYLAESRKNNDNEEISDLLKNKAVQELKLAIQNKKSCSKPDEAAWLLFQNSQNADTLSLSVQKKIIEGFIQTYPASPFLEEWLHTLAANQAFDSTQTKDSIKYFTLLIKKYADSEHLPDYLFEYAQYLNMIKPSEAITYFKRIASEFPYAHMAAEALFEVASDYETKGKYAEAYILYAKLLKQYGYASVSAEVTKRLPGVLVQSGKYQQAVQLIKPMLNNLFLTDAVLSREFLSDSDFDKMYYLAVSYDGLGKSLEALTYFQKYLKLSVNGSFRDEALLKLGTLYFEMKQFDTAKEKFLSIKNIKPDIYRQAQTYLAELYFRQKKYEQAANVYSALIPLFSKQQAKAANLSEQYIVSLIRAGKIADSKKAIKQHNKQFTSEKISSARFSVELADYYRKNKKYDKAVRILNSVKKKYKSSEFADDADYMLALIHISLNHIEDAFKILTKFYNKYPQSDRLSAALNTLGNLYFRSEKYDNAIIMFKNALKANHDQELGKNITSNLIKTYTLTGFWDAAQALAREYVKTYPTADDLLDKKIIIAQAYINLNQFQNAVEYLKKIKLEADADREPEIQFYIGEALLKGGQYENAIAEFVKIPLLSKKTKLQWEASALYYSGQSYEKLGRTDDAIRMYEEIIRRPGIDLILKKEAKKRIKQIQ